MNGWQTRAKDPDKNRAVYISNLPKTGHISIVIGKNLPTLIDMTDKDVEARIDIPAETFGDIWRAVVKHLIKDAPPKPWIVDDTAEPTEPIEINTIREGMVETPEIVETPEKAVRRPRGRRPRVPKAVLND